MQRSGWTMVLALLAGTAAVAQVPMHQEPRHRVVFETGQFRVLDVSVPPGDTTLEHKHDYDLVTVSMMTAGADTRSQPAGQPWGAVRPRRPLGHAAITDNSGNPSAHRIENVGSSPYQLFVVETLRTGGWSTAGPLSAIAATLAAESRAFRVYDVKLTRPITQSSHTHAVTTIAVLMSGKVLSEGSDQEVKGSAPAPVGLKQMDQPGQWVLVPEGGPHHLTSLGSGDSYVVEIEIR